MQSAWKRVKANKGASGIDKMPIEKFPDFARDKWDSIRESLSDGSYQPLPVKRVKFQSLRVEPALWVSQPSQTG